MPLCDAKDIGGFGVSVPARVADYWLISSSLLIYYRRRLEGASCYTS
jgi:hypothetical protein